MPRIRSRGTLRAAAACSFALAISWPLLPLRAQQRQVFPLPEAAGAPPPAPGVRRPAPSAIAPPRLPSGSLAPSPQTAAPRPLMPATDPGRGFRYRLGPGDQLRMAVFKVEGYEAEVTVLSDGTINLPRLGSVPVWGLTLDEARQRITQGYDRYLRRPLVYLDLLAPRPVRVTLVGEVQKPGFYSLTQGSSTSNLQANGPAGGGTTMLNAGWPTLVDAVQRAGGITAVADLSSIVLVRPPAVPGGAPVEFRFDYLSVLMEGGETVNPLLYDGDMIRIARAEGVLPNDVLIRTAASNFAPDTIAVTVVGEVMSPGLKQVRSNSPLVTAVMAAGDLNQLRADANFIRLLRLQSDGSIASSRLRFDPAAPLGSANNPALQNGDMIVVARNGWTSFNERLAQAVAPLGPLLNAASLYNILRQGP
ncbi:MAG: polysaccharide biosynthesis/export family protein [Cyanobium sp.]|nr:polysaccharide biosynthesis/export family protein [Cyanobium sp.]